MKPLKVKYNNKLVLSNMLKQYAYIYFIKFCDWFDKRSGASYPQA